MTNNKSCPCGSSISLQNCCALYIYGGELVPTAEKLMRSRYTAYCLQQADYLYETTHVSQRKYTNKSDILAWAKQNTWQKLEILYFSENSVEFKAYYLDENQIAQVHHEKSTFINFQEHWYYVDGKFF